MEALTPFYFCFLTTILVLGQVKFIFHMIINSFFSCHMELTNIIMLLCERYGSHGSFHTILFIFDKFKTDRYDRYTQIT